MPKPAAGFTLTELLVVLGILAVLAAILLPVLWQARQRGRQTVCASNLRQISAALPLYVSDNDSIYPPTVIYYGDKSGHADRTDYWSDLLSPYVKSSFPVCPNRSLDGAFADHAEDFVLCGYAYNHNLSQNVSTKDTDVETGRSEAFVGFPALMVTLFDARVGIVSVTQPDTDAVWHPQGELTITTVVYHSNSDAADIKVQSPGATRHGGGANYAFADGHVHGYRPEQLSMTAKSDGLHPGFGL